MCSGGSGALLHKITVDAPIHSLYIPPLSHQLLAGGEEGLLTLHDMATGDELLCIALC